MSRRPLASDAPPPPKPATLYVPRRATEDALATLTSLLRVGATRIALRGPGGIGKTTLLEVSRERLAGRIRAVRVPDPAIPPESIAERVLASLGEPCGDDAERQLVALARELREQGSGLAILIDAAERMPLPTARRLSRLAADARPALSLVFALGDAPEADALLAALDSPLEEVPLREAMSLPETRAYLAARRACDAAPGALAPPQGDSEIEAIHHRSGGIPGAIERAARELAEAARPEPPAAVPRASTSRPEPDTPLAAARHSAPGPAPEPESPRERHTGEVATPGVRPQRSKRTAVAFAALAAGLALLLLARSPDPDSGSVPATPTAVAPEPEPPAPQTHPGSQPAPIAIPAPIASAVPNARPNADRLPDSASGVRTPVRDSAAAPAATPEAPTEPTRAESTLPTIPVSINAAPWARISVDGKAAGVTPLADLPLTPGSHAFRAEFPDGRVVERTEAISVHHRRVLFR